MTPIDSIGARISAFRHQKKMTQEALAINSGIHQSTLSDIENDKTSPTAKVIMDIAKALDLPASSLLPDGGNIFNNEANDSVNNINHYYNDFDEERKVWQSLVNAKDETIAVKDALIVLLQRSVPS